MKQIEIAGRRFGRLVAVDSNTKDSSGTLVWRCICDCGKECFRRTTKLLRGESESCGCLSKERLREKLRINNTSHGMYGTKEYASWRAMFNRCFNPKTKNWDLYGGANIEVDECIAKDFNNFLNEVGKQPDDNSKWTLERIDNTLGYIKGNLKWVNQEHQNRNRGKMINNTSGVTGVGWRFDKRRNQTFASASWYETVDGVHKRRYKYFDVGSYGLLPAFANAVLYRKNQIERLNMLGYGYSSSHGIISRRLV